MNKLIIVILIYILSHAVFASENITVDLQNVKLTSAIYYLAKFLNRNVMLDPSIHGVTTLHLKNVSADAAFDTLLASNDLVKKTMGMSWFITSRQEFLKRQQDAFKVQELSDESQNLLTKFWHIRFAKAEDIAHFIQDSASTLLSRRGRLRMDVRTNMVFVQDTPMHLAEIQQVINQLDVQVQQVSIEARIASVDHDFERLLGIQFGVNDAAAETNSTASTEKKQYSLAVVKLADGSLLDVRLSALETEGHGELISSPSLFTANQQTASIEAGEEIPYQEVSRSGATSVAFKKAVLSLKVTPQIMPGSKVLLQLQVNQDKPSKRMVLGVPAISTRQIITNILVKSGQTVVLGGIYESNREKGNERIPFFGKIPLIGWLFQQNNTTENKRELLVFVTPRIM